MFGYRLLSERQAVRPAQLKLKSVESAMCLETRLINDGKAPDRLSLDQAWATGNVSLRPVTFWEVVRVGPIAN